TNTWSGLPVAIAALGAALASLPIARAMGRFGRRPGLVLGYGLGVVGSALGMAGVLTRSFPLLLLGMALFGVGNTSNLLARYAAADVSPGAQRGRAIGVVVWGSTAGSVIGPNLLGPAALAGGLLALPVVGSPFLIGLGVVLHLPGMYAASPLTGWLCDRVGRLPVIVAGGLMLIGALALAGLTPGSNGGLVILGLFLNGVGWNFGFVAGSALLTDAIS